MYFKSVVSKLVLVGAVAAAQGAPGSSVYARPSTPDSRFQLDTAASGERARLLTLLNLDPRIAAWGMHQCPMPVHQPNLAAMKWLQVEVDTAGMIPMPTVRPGCHNPLGPAMSLDRPTVRLRQLEVKP